MPECLITGCRFVDEEGGRHAWGDLHAVGSALVFNAILDEKGETAWTYDWPPPNPETDKQVSALPEIIYFERRGVLVWDKEGSWFNSAARDHLLRWRQWDDETGALDG